MSEIVMRDVSVKRCTISIGMNEVTRGTQNIYYVRCFSPSSSASSVNGHLKFEIALKPLLPVQGMPVKYSQPRTSAQTRTQGLCLTTPQNDRRRWP